MFPVRDTTAQGLALLLSNVLLSHKPLRETRPFFTLCSAEYSLIPVQCPGVLLKRPNDWVLIFDLRSLECRTQQLDPADDELFLETREAILVAICE